MPIVPASFRGFSQWIDCGNRPMSPWAEWVAA